jgi:hypothetical protein
VANPNSSVPLTLVDLAVGIAAGGSARLARQGSAALRVLAPAGRVPGLLAGSVADRVRRGRLHAEGEAARAAAVAAGRRLFGTVVRQVLDAVLDQVDMTGLVERRLDLDRLVRLVELDAVAARLDLDAIAARLDIEAVLARLDLTHLVEQRVDLDRIASHLDIDAIAARLDIEAVLARLDLTHLVEQRVDLDRIASHLDIDAIAARLDMDAVLARLDLTALATRSSRASTCRGSSASPPGRSRPRASPAYGCGAWRPTAR